MSKLDSVSEALESSWSGMSVYNRSLLINSLGLKPENQHLNGLTLDQVVHMPQDELPGVVRGRLIYALNPDGKGFSIDEYRRTKEAWSSRIERC